MHKIVILLKTYIGDIEYVERLITSYKKYNIDNIPLYMVVPNLDLFKFEKYIEKNIKVLSDESITNCLVSDDSVRGIRPGYINQEIIKLAFWEKKLCENYFCMDSDGVFIRNFYISDFMFDKETPYTILVEDHELAVEPKYFSEHWQARENLIRIIQEEVGLVDKRMLTCHGLAIFSCKVLESFYNKFLISKNMTYIDILKISPYEFSWYNMWLQKDKTINIEFKEPLIKSFHNSDHHLDYLRKGITLDDIARGYIGYNINSNYSRGYGVVNFENEAMLFKYESELSIKEIILEIIKLVYYFFKKIIKKLLVLMSKIKRLILINNK